MAKAYSRPRPRDKLRRQANQETRKNLHNYQEQSAGFTYPVDDYSRLELGRFVNKHSNGAQSIRARGHHCRGRSDIVPSDEFGHSVYTQKNVYGASKKYGVSIDYGELRSGLSDSALFGQFLLAIGGVVVFTNGICVVRFEDDDQLKELRSCREEISDGLKEQGVKQIFTPKHGEEHVTLYTGTATNSRNARDEAYYIDNRLREHNIVNIGFEGLTIGRSYRNNLPVIEQQIANQAILATV